MQIKKIMLLIIFLVLLAGCIGEIYGTAGTGKEGEGKEKNEEMYEYAKENIGIPENIENEEKIEEKIVKPLEEVIENSKDEELLKKSELLLAIARNYQARLLMSGEDSEIKEVVKGRNSEKRKKI